MRFKKTKTPCQEERKGSLYDLWGELTLQYGDKILLECEWEMHRWILNFIEKKKNLLIEKYPFRYVNSIKESDDLLMDSIDFGNLDDESTEIPESAFELVELYSDYISRHSFHLDETTTQRFYIGLNPSGYGEISYYVENEDRYYKYEFDMPTFVAQADAAIIHYLKKFQLKLTSDEEYFKKFLGEEYAQYIGENARLDAMSFGF
ncbi:hypothetical protein [Lactovum odontotermitis]